jgi:signal peptidase II
MGRMPVVERPTEDGRPIGTEGPTGAEARGLAAWFRCLPEFAARLCGVWGTALVWTALDQLVKQWALTALWSGEREVIAGVLWFNLVRNPGAAFGLFPGGKGFFVAIGVLLIGVGVWAPLVMGGKRLSLGVMGLGVLVGGGVGNLMDRLFRGGQVVDFIDFRFWPIFNFADMGIVIGTGLVFIYLVRNLFRPEAKAK